MHVVFAHGIDNLRKDSSMMKTKQSLIKLLAATLAFLFVISGMTFPTFAADTSTETQSDLGDRLVAMNVAASGQVSLMLYFTDLDHVDYFKVTLPERDGKSETKTVYKNQLTIDGKGRYLLKVAVPAAQQTETIKVQPCKVEDDGSVKGGKIRSYSIRDYANMVFALAEKDPDTYYLVCQALKAMLNYGAMAQLEFNHLPEQLANTGLYEDGSNPAYGFTSDHLYNINTWVEPESSTNIKIVSTACSLEETISIKIYINYTGSGTLTLTLGDGQGTTIVDEFYEDADGKYALINGIPATWFNNLYTIKITDGKETASCKFSVLNYAQLALEKLEDSDTTNDVISADLAGAMYQYYQWASAYVAGKTDGLVDPNCGHIGHIRRHVELKGTPGETCSDCGYFFARFNILSSDSAESCPTKDHNVEAYWYDRKAIHYNASNVDSYGSDGIRFNYTDGPSSLELSGFWNPDELDESFNRFSLSYYSSEPVEITLKYNDSQDSAVYYLEKGEQTFSAVLPEFLDSKKASSFDSIVVKSCESDTEVSFVLYDYVLETLDLSTPTTLSAASVSLAGSSILTMDGDASFTQKLSIDLAYGGAITWLSHIYVGKDYSFVKNVKESQLAQYDWQTDKGTRLVDVQILDIPSKYNHMAGFSADKYPAIYVKYLIGENEEETATYFECTYSVVYNDGGISVLQVDTRQIDFSGDEGEFTTHSLPDLHTIAFSYHLYAADGGNEDWGTGALTPYETTTDPITYHFRSSTKEAWCAWVSDEISGVYPAIGIFVPNVDSFEAQLGAKTGLETMTDYNSKENYARLAMQKTMKTYSYEAIEYSYLIAISHSVDHIRDEFGVLSGFAQNEDLNNDCVPTRIPDEEPDMTNISFAHEQMGLLLRDANNSIVRYCPSNASAGIEVTGSAHSVKLDFTLYDHLKTTEEEKIFLADEFVQLRLTYMVPEGDAAAVDGKVNCKIYLCTGTTETLISTEALDADGIYSTAVIDVSGFTGDIDALKFVFPDATDGTIYLRGVQLLTEEKRVTGADYIAEVDATTFLTVTNTGTNKYENDSIKLVPSTVDPYFTVYYNKNGLNLTASNYKTLKFTYMMPTTNTREAYNCDVTITTSNGEEAKIRCTATASDGNWHTVMVALPELTGTLVSIKLEYLDYNSNDNTYTNDAFYLYSFILSAKTIGEELASVDFTKKGSAYIQYSVAGELKGYDEEGNLIYDLTADSFTHAYSLNDFIGSINVDQTGVAFDETSGSLTLTAQDGGTVDFDPYIFFRFDELNVSTDDYSGIRIKYKIPEGSSANQTAQLFIDTDGMESNFDLEGWKEVASIFDRLVVDGEYHYLEFDFSKLIEDGYWEEDYWSGNIENIRLDYIITYYPGEANTMYITAVELIPAS